MAVESERLWTLLKRRGCYVAELLTFGDAVWVNFRRDGQRVAQVSYASREDALRDALDYRAALEMAGWSVTPLTTDFTLS
jgi:hypothetical protein